MRFRTNRPIRVVKFIVLMGILFIVSNGIGSWYDRWSADSGSSNPQPRNARHSTGPINPHPNESSRHPSNISLPDEIRILYWTNVFIEHHPSSQLTINRLNGTITCHVTGDHREFSRSHLVVFHFHLDSWSHLKTRRGVRLPPKHPRWQKWVYYTQEPPTWIRLIRGDIALVLENSINVLATYMRSSDVPLPYGEFVTRDTQGSAMLSDQMQAGINAASGKSKLATILVSNCGEYADYSRIEFVHQLQKRIPLDVYGKCGTLIPGCIQNNSTEMQHQCLSKLGQMYKFYLSLENSDCDDYITEKYWKNALQYNMVPVVRGKRNNYDNFAIPGSYIHADLFSSIRVLADYLLLLDRNDTLYNEYFAWKSHYSVVDSRLTSDYTQDTSQVDSRLCQWAIDNRDQAPKHYTLSKHIDRFTHCNLPDSVQDTSRFLGKPKWWRTA